MKALVLVVLALADVNGPSRGFDAKNCGLLRTIAPHGGSLLSASFSPDGRTLAVSCADGTVRFYEGPEWREVRRLQTQAGELMRVAFSPDGGTIAVGSIDGWVRLFDARTFEPGPALKGHAAGNVFMAYALAFSPDGKAILSTANDAAPRVWKFGEGAAPVVLKGHARAVVSAAFSLDGMRAATAEGNGAIRVWRTHGWEEEASVAGSEEELLAVMFSRDGRKLFAGLRGGVNVYDAGTGRLERTVAGIGGDGYPRLVMPGERYVLGVGADASVRIWDLARGKETVRLAHHTEAVAALACHPGGRLFASVGRDRHLKIWGPLPGGMARVRPRGFCGIRVQQNAGGGVVITEVIPGTPAQRAGLKEGDVIRRVDGAAINNPTESSDAIGSRLEEEEVEIQMERGGQSRTLRVKLGKRPPEVDR